MDLQRISYVLCVVTSQRTCLASLARHRALYPPMYPSQARKTQRKSLSVGTVCRPTERPVQEGLPLVQEWVTGHPCFETVRVSDVTARVTLSRRERRFRFRLARYRFRRASLLATGTLLGDPSTNLGPHIHLHVVRLHQCSRRCDLRANVRGQASVPHSY